LATGKQDPDLVARKNFSGSVPIGKFTKPPGIKETDKQIAISPIGYFSVREIDFSFSYRFGHPQENSIFQ